MLRVPNALLASSATGRTNASVHNRSADEDCQTRSSSLASRSIRSRSDSGGVTNAGSTVRVRVRNTRRATTRSCEACTPAASIVAE